MRDPQKQRKKTGEKTALLQSERGATQLLEYGSLGESVKLEHRGEDKNAQYSKR